MQETCSMLSVDVHAIRQKLQLVLAVADGPNAPIIERAVKEIDKILPTPAHGWFRSAFPPHRHV